MTSPAMLVVPCAGAELTLRLLCTPLTEAVRSIGVAVLYATLALLAATVGAAGVATVSVTVAAAEVPPGPVAV